VKLLLKNQKKPRILEKYPFNPESNTQVKSNLALLTPMEIYSFHGLKSFLIDFTVYKTNHFFKEFDGIMAWQYVPRLSQGVM
jgi:hypothetical protein